MSIDNNKNDEDDVNITDADFANLETFRSLLEQCINSSQQEPETDDDEDDISEFTPIDTDDYQVIWLHSEQTKLSSKRSWMETQLKLIFNRVQIFDDTDACLTFLESLSNACKLFLLGNGTDDHERIKPAVARFPICHLFWNRQSQHRMKSFVYLRKIFIELCDADDDTDDHAEREKLREAHFNYVIVVFHPKTLDHPFDKIRARLDTVFDRLIYFDEWQTSADYIETSVEVNTSIYLVLCDYNDPTIPNINKPIKSIYSLRSTALLCSHQHFDNIEQLITALRRDVRAPVIDFSFGLVQKSARQLDAMKAPYTSFMGLLDVFLSLTRNSDRPSAQADFLSTCRAIHKDNAVQMRVIDRFAQEYQSFEQAIGWYTRDSFAYRLVNQALRSQNPDIIHKYRFFINDLIEHLEHVHQIEKTNGYTVEHLVVYRGQGMYLRELKRLQRHIGKEYALNSFYSATRDRDMAVEFSLVASNGSDIVSVLVIVEIDRTLVYIRPIVSIEHLSVIAEEREILISMGSLFRLASIEFDPTLSVWIIRMILLNFDQNDVKKIQFYPLTHKVTLETYRETKRPIEDEDGVHPFFEAGMSDTLLVNNYVKAEKQIDETIEQETARLKKEMEDIFRIYGKRN